MSEGFSGQRFRARDLICPGVQAHVDSFYLGGKWEERYVFSSTLPSKYNDRTTVPRAGLDASRIIEKLPHYHDALLAPELPNHNFKTLTPEAYLLV